MYVVSVNHTHRWIMGGKIVLYASKYFRFNILDYFLRARNGELAGDEVVLGVYDDEKFHMCLLMRRCICVCVGDAF